jgi:hypothetical protein
MVSITVEEHMQGCLQWHRATITEVWVRGSGLVAGIVLSYEGMFSEEMHCSTEDWMGGCPYSLNEVWGF